MKLRLLISKFVVPKMACKVIDRAIQMFGAEGLSQDQELAGMYGQLRTLRMADVSVWLLRGHDADESLCCRDPMR